MKHLGTKELNTGRLILRRFDPDDGVRMYENWASDPEVVKFLTWPAHGSPEISRMILEDWANNYRREEFYQWAICYEGEPIGSISAVRVNEQAECVEIGYCIGRKWWHRGITSEALREVIRFFFEEVGANRVEARHDANNPNSGKVMRKCGIAV